MLAILLGSVLTLGAGLLASAALSDGALLASRTAAQLIGWALVLAPLAAARGLERHVAQLGAAAVAVAAGTSILYVAYFEWGHVAVLPEAQATVIAPESLAAAQPAPVEHMPAPPAPPAEPVAPQPVAAPAPAPATVLYRQADPIPDSPPY